MPEKKSSGEKLGEAMRAKGIALSIPMAMLGYPLVGAFSGKFLGDYLELPWLVLVGLALGLVAAARESASLLKRLSAGK